MKHPCHKNQIASIRRIKGQIEGVERMINEGKYCIDILNQIKAANLLGINRNTLRKKIKDYDLVVTRGKKLM